MLVRCPRGEDRERIDAILGEIGVRPRWSGEPAPEALGEVDLALADADDGALLEGLLRGLEEVEGREPTPLILLGDPERLAELTERTAGRFDVRVLPRSCDRETLVRAIRSALALKCRCREGRRLAEQLRRADAAAEWFRSEVQAEIRRRTQLLAAVGHELRTPIHEVGLFCHIVRAAARAPGGQVDWERLIAGLESGVESLRALVDDLFDIAQFDLGTMEFADSVFALGPFLERVAQPFLAPAAARGLALVTAVSPPGARARTDPEKLARVVQNLLSNAVKFTDAGRIDVAVHAEPGGPLRLVVRDTGCGIEPALHGSIFDEFAQLHNPERSRAKGVGLGLAICRRIVDALGGRIELESAPHRGSTFTVHLPHLAVVDPG